jgi:hypothetical protein
MLCEYVFRSCASPSIGAWLLICLNILSFHLSFTHFFIAFRIRLGISHLYNYTYFTMSVWSHCWWFGYPFVTLSRREWVHCNLWYVSKYHCNYCIKKCSSCTKRGFSTFPLSHTKMNVYCHHQRQFLNLGRCCHCRLDS